MARPLPPAAALAEVAVSLGGTLLDVRHIGRDARGNRAWSPWLARYTLGEGPDVQLPLALAGCGADGSFTLVEAVPAGIRLALGPTMTGSVRRDESTADVAAMLARGEHTLILSAGASATLQVGPLEIVVRVEASTPMPRYRAQLDRPLWLAQAGALALFAVLMVVVQRVEPGGAEADFRDPDVQAKLIRYFTPAEPPVAPAHTGVATRAPTVAPAPVEPAPIAEPAPDMSVATGPRGQGLSDMARSAGIFSLGDFMAALKQSEKDARASMDRYVAAANETAVWAKEAARDPLRDTLGLVGTGRQGGGAARDVVDLEIGLIARTDASGKRRYGGAERAARETFAERDPAPTPERRTSVVWTASVGRDLIRGVVNRNRPEVRACFRDGAARNPGLRGEIEVAFTIQEDGTVAYPSVARSTLEDKAVEACVTAAVKRWKFPTFVASGGDVDVRFPFTVGAA
jgi:TonB family protein